MQAAHADVLSKTLSGTQSRRNGFRRIQVWIAGLQRYFEGFNVPAVFVGVLAQRGQRSWRDDTIERVRSFSTELANESFAQVEAIDKAAEQNLAYLWPSERSNMTKEMDAARSRLAGPALRAGAQEVIRSARGYDGAVSLASWESQEHAILKWASNTEKKESLDHVDSKLDDLLTPLMSKELKQLKSFGGGLNAVSKGRAWISGFRARYAFAIGRPPLLAATNQFEKWRAYDLADAQAEIAKEIVSQKSLESLDHFVGSHLVLPEDEKSEAGAAIASLVRERRRTLEMDLYLSEHFSAHERRLMEDHPPMLKSIRKKNRNQRMYSSQYFAPS